MAETVKPLLPPGPVIDRGVASDRVVGEAEASGAVSDYSLKPKKTPAPRQADDKNVVDFTAFKSKVTIHSGAYFDAKKWKRSRVKKGWLIARIKGYDPVESEYGVSYLKVLSRRPKRTSGDCSLYEHAGFATWSALQAGGRFVKERKRYGRFDENRANAS